MTTTLVYGLAITGEALVKALRGRGDEVIVADDQPSEHLAATAARLGARWVGQPDSASLGPLLGSVDRLCPAPGLAERSHPVILAALGAGVPIRTEIDLAYEWEQERAGGPRPILAVTGTDGKTTTTLMAEAILRAAGRRPSAVGNTEVPFVDALGSDADCFVVECSSFRLNWLDSFRADASVWLNLAPDHQNWHRDLSSYVRAKERMWANVHPGDVAVGPTFDPVVVEALGRAACRRVTFGPGGDYRREEGRLVGPSGALCEVAAMSRALPHDVTNALAAAAITIESGLADAAAVAAALSGFEHPPHRIERVAERDGVSWYNDSKATTPHAAMQAIRSFEHVVLIAGGRNKELDLGELASEPQRIRAVVAIGDAADEVAAAFAGVCPVEIVCRGGMDAVVPVAARLARAGDAVLLSPACASYDWYGGYPERGDDFRRAARDHAASVPAGEGA